MRRTNLIDVGEIADEPRRIFWATIHYRRWVASVFPTFDCGTDISIQQLSVLYLIRTQDASMAEIARTLQVAPTVVTGLVDRLELRGLLRRERDHADRRRIRLVLTPEGQRVSEELETGFANLIEQSIQKLSPVERDELSRGLDLLNLVIADLERGVETNR